eukprot:jgi/Botrbrau1/20340/Bobra.0006s0013.5
MILLELKHAAKGSPLMDEPTMGRLSEEARAFLAKDAALLALNPITLSFQSPGIEAAFMAEVAKQRWPVLLAIFVFDCVCYLVRIGARGIGTGGQGIAAMLAEIPFQLGNMAMLHLLTFWINWRSRRHHRHAQGGANIHQRWSNSPPEQEELLLSAVMAAAITNLLLSLPKERSQDYVFAAYFLICTASLLKIRWMTGCLVLSSPLILLFIVGGRWNTEHLPRDAGVQLVVAWATGALMSYLADSYRRQMFANQQLARAAAEKEIEEARARSAAQHALAAAQQQAAQRALTVAREKAANEAKSEFMSLMCHEVRTPLNGCLASAEMLLESDLQEEQRELAKTIRVSGSILLSTVSNFLDFFKMEAGKQLDIVRTEMDLQEIVNDVHCVVEAMIGRSSDVVLLPAKLCRAPPLVMGDPDRLKGILLNLCTNAAKFTKRGAIAVRVSVTGPNFRPKPHTPDTFSGLRPANIGNSPVTTSAATPVPPSLQWVAAEQRDQTASLSSIDAHVLRKSLQLLAERQQRAEEMREASGPAGTRNGLLPTELHRHSTGELPPPVADFLASSLYSSAPGNLSPNVTPAQLARIAADRPAVLEVVRTPKAEVPNPFEIARTGGQLGANPAAGPSPGQEPPATPVAAVSQVRKLRGPAGETGALPGPSCARPVEQGTKEPGELAESPKTPRQRDCEGPEDSANTASAAEPLFESLRTMRSRDKPPLPPSTPEDSRSASLRSSAELLGPASLGSEAPGTPDFGISDEPLGHAHQPLQASGCTSLADSMTDPSAGRQDSSNTSSSNTSSSNGEDSGSPEPSPRTPKGPVPLFEPAPSCPDAHGWHSVVSRSGGNVSTSSVKLGEESEGQWLVFEVSDTGCGIAREGLRSLFQEYVQGTEDEMRRPRTRGGTGLGLSICSKQVAVLGGHIGAMSKLGEGTTFWFTIPLIRPPQPVRNQSPEFRRRTASWGSRDAFTDGHFCGAAPGEAGGAAAEPRADHPRARFPQTVQHAGPHATSLLPAGPGSVLHSV